MNFATLSTTGTGSGDTVGGLVHHCPGDPSVIMVDPTAHMNNI